MALYRWINSFYLWRSGRARRHRKHKKERHRRYRHRTRSRSLSGSKSPYRRRSHSVTRHSKSPRYHRSRSPQLSKSPRRRSKSPVYHSKSPRRSISPYMRSKSLHMSNTKSPLKARSPLLSPKTPLSSLKTPLISSKPPLISKAPLIQNKMTRSPLMSKPLMKTPLLANPPASTKSLPYSNNRDQERLLSDKNEIPGKKLNKNNNSSSDAVDSAQHSSNYEETKTSNISSEESSRAKTDIKNKQILLDIKEDKSPAHLANKSVAKMDNRHQPSNEVITTMVPTPHSLKIPPRTNLTPLNHPPHATPNFNFAHPLLNTVPTSSHHHLSSTTLHHHHHHHHPTSHHHSFASNTHNYTLTPSHHPFSPLSSLSHLPPGSSFSSPLMPGPPPTPLLLGGVIGGFGRGIMGGLLGPAGLALPGLRYNNFGGARRGGATLQEQLAKAAAAARMSRPY